MGRGSSTSASRDWLTLAREGVAAACAVGPSGSQREVSRYFGAEAGAASRAVAAGEGGGRAAVKAPPVWWEQLVLRGL